MRCYCETCGKKIAWGETCHHPVVEQCELTEVGIAPPPPIEHVFDPVKGASTVVSADGKRMVHAERIARRPSFAQIYLATAGLMAKRSTCRRLAVGCVIASADYRRIYSVGYNGNACGLPNDCDSETPGACGCIHAEANAVVSCTAPHGAKKVVLVTHLPCVACAKLIVQLGGVERVIYAEDYRIKASLDVLRAAGIAVGKCEPLR